jgi:hypothetical protein
LAKNLGDRITVWAPFNMPWSFTYLGYGVGVFPPGRASYGDFLKAAHTVNLGQGQAFRAINAASSKATVGNAYGMAPAYPKTGSEADRAAADRYHAMNNVYFLETAIHGRYPKAFVGEIPYETMGFHPGDDRIMKVPLDWIGFHYYTCRIVSDAKGASRPGSAGSFGTEIEDTSGGRDPYTQFSAVMPTEGPAVERLDAGFSELPDFSPSCPGSEQMGAVLLALAEKLHDNNPYFHPMYAGQMLKPPHAVARLAYTPAMHINPNNHALDSGRASSTLEKEAVAEIGAMFGWRESLGHLCGGGTMANLEALWVAGQDQSSIKRRRLFRGSREQISTRERKERCNQASVERRLTKMRREL